MTKTNHPFFSKESSEWYTPLHIIEICREIMGSIDLDPASNYYANCIVKATEYYESGGLDLDWHADNVFCNPPYLGNAGIWAEKFAEEHIKLRMGQGILLVKSAHGYNWYEETWDRCNAACFVRERLEFLKLVVDPRKNVKQRDGSLKIVEREIVMEFGGANRKLYLVKNGPAKAGTSLFYFGPRPAHFVSICSMRGLGKTWRRD